MPADQDNNDALRILVLDDEPLIVMDIEFSLTDEGFDALGATNKDKAMSIARDTALVGAILDINLGHGITSFEVADALQEQGVPFVFHSADLKTHADIIEKYGAVCLSKPSNERDILAAVRTMSGQSRQSV